MRNLLLALPLIVLTCTAYASEILSIDPMNYANLSAAQVAWTPVDNSAQVLLATERTPDGKPAVAFPCDMSKVSQRSYWDKQIDVNMSRYGRIAFWVKAVGDLSALSHNSFYFSSGKGWYSSSFAIDGNRWQRVIIDRSRFQAEEDPDSWAKLSAMRMSFWKGQDKKVTVYVGPIEAFTSDIVIVRNARAGEEGAPYAESMSNTLASAGIDSITIDDADAETGALEGKRIAIYPNNPMISDKEMDALEAFVAAGGRVVALYSIQNRLADLLGMGDLGYQARKYEGQFAEIRTLNPNGKDALPGMPAKIHQLSWNITTASPKSRNARVFSKWYDINGKDTGLPAILISDTGVFVSHVMLHDDPANWSRTLRALLGKYDDSLWPEIARNASVNAGRMIPIYDNFDSAYKGIESQAKRLKVVSAQKELVKSRKAYNLSVSLMKAKQYPKALDSIETQATALVKAYALIQPSKANEFRAVWCHSAYGVDGMTWDGAIKKLKDNGFTAVVPNMLWGGQTDYPSKVLPVNPRVQKDGDQIAQCLTACRKYGIEIHVWKVNWNMGNASKDFVTQMKAEKRTQQSSTGVIEPWLCPSNPANQTMELESMLEIVKNYAVDGIHFDYIRYPDSEHCYCDGCRERFEALVGVRVESWPKDVLRYGPAYEAYQQFRRDNITRLVKAVSEGARSINPKMKISAAVFSNWPDCRESEGQDWGRWIELGYLDFVCPMDYTDSASAFRTMVQVQRGAVKGKIPLYPGIGASAPGLTAAQVIDQVKIAREEKANGFIIFNYDIRTASDQIPMLGLGATRK
jgi:uncharacterized lipoprotein YddW (UPF0748 family)